MLLTDRLVFMGSPDYALPTLNALVETYGSQVVAVCTQPDKPKGRGLETVPTPVKQRALELGIPVHTPLTKEEVAAQALAYAPTLIVVIAYGMILPKTVTDAVPCLNLHGSLLPAYRGASPIQAALLNGDSETGITLIRMNEHMDAGPMLAQEKLEILPQDNGGTLFEKLAHLSAHTLINFLKNNTTPLFLEHPQDDTSASYCKKLHAEDFRLYPDTELPETLLHKIRAFCPRPGAFLIHNGKRVKIFEATLDQNKLIPTLIQPEGKGKMTYKEFLAGHPPIL